MRNTKLSYYFKKGLKHFRDFHFVWILLVAVLLAPFYFHIMKGMIVYIVIASFICYLIWRPLGAVFGLIGTSGSIRLFFANFVLITFLFSLVYYYGFFKNAGITYDINQPHIDYQLFADSANSVSAKVPEQSFPKRDTILLEHQLDSKTFHETVITTDSLHYQRIDFVQVWRSTILTTLTQEPADLLVVATIHNAAQKSSNVILNKRKSDLFEWILICHIIVSWIFFGVFISLLYNKFRYES